MKLRRSLGVSLLSFLPYFSEGANFLNTTDKVGVGIPPTFPNIGYLGSGYDIMFGNPHSTRVLSGPDPGYRTAIFDLSVYNGSVTPDQRYRIPEGVDIEKCAKCATEFSTKESTGMRSVTSSFQEDVNIDAGGWGAKFSADVDYKSMETSTTNSKDVYTQTSAVCCVYVARLNQYAIAPFSANFKAAVAGMPALYDDAYFANFLKSFGTHVPLSVTMGGRFGVQSKLSQTSYSLLKSSDLKIDVAASYSSLAFSAAAKTMTDIQKKQASEFSQMTSSQGQFAVGGSIPADGTVNSWIKSCQQEPMPLSVDLVALTNLFTPSYFPDDPKIAHKHDQVVNALDKYCSKLLAAGKVSRCTVPPPDPPFPPASIFGALYQTDSCGRDNVNNPYSKRMACPTGYAAHTVGSVHSPEGGCQSNQILCLATGKTADPQGMFGGMYQHSDAGSTRGNHPNPMTGGYTCPTGYSKFRSGRILTMDNVGATQYLCMKTGFLGKTPFGGAFQCSDAGNSNDLVPNPFTKACSCPSGYKIYKYGRVLAPEAGVGASQHICLNNVFT